MEQAPLVQSILTLTAEDAFRPRYADEHWRLFMSYLTRHELQSGHALIHQDRVEQAAYFLEEGNLTVFVTGRAAAGQRLAILRAGSAVGEPALFGNTPRMANVETMTHSVVWELSRARFDDMATSRPSLALEALRAFGAVMAVRMRANLDRGNPLS
jgi:CRP/FNR family transcriptional regulator, cyclic AMP receptor protein